MGAVNNNSGMMGFRTGEPAAEPGDSVKNRVFGFKAGWNPNTLINPGASPEGGTGFTGAEGIGLMSDKRPGPEG